MCSQEEKKIAHIHSLMPDGKYAAGSATEMYHNLIPWYVYKNDSKNDSFLSKLVVSPAGIETTCGNIVSATIWYMCLQTVNSEVTGGTYSHAAVVAPVQL